MDKPLLAYNGNHVFHFTSFEAALKIISSTSLKFGSFKNMNDIAEVRREFFGILPEEKYLEVIEKYQSISLTEDKQKRRGFAIDPLWGHYAQNGNGVCLVFNKKLLKHNLKIQFGDFIAIRPIDYLVNFSNGVFDNETVSSKEIEQFVISHIEDIFFTKSIDWQYEQEIRILIKNEKDIFLKFDDATLCAIILCLPKVDDYKESNEFKILKAILPYKPILRYTTMLGDKRLINETGAFMCDKIGFDCEIDLD